MGVVVTAASGFDLDYVWRNQGQASTERTAGGYYIDAAQDGEPPGRWWGPGAEALGFHEGQIVEREPYDLVYRQIDPRTGEKLGRSRGSYANFEAHFAALKAAEPHATAERLLELEREAAQATRQAAAYTDMTVSFSKSISVLHASIRENARRARIAGNEVEAARWEGAELDFQEVLQAANRSGLEYVQKWAGMTRAGYHGTRVAGREPGRFEEALITVTSWLQGTSRDGDPQDHIHNQVARIVQTVSDGKHRALDTVCLRQVLGAVQAIVATHAESALTKRFGVKWIARPDGCGNEISGVPQDQMDAYSSRTVTIKEDLPAAVAEWTRKYGRAPNRRQLAHIAQEVTLASRNGKREGEIDWDALCAKWDAKLGGDLASIAPRVSDLRAPGSGADAAPREPELSASPSREELTRAVQKALALVQEKHSTWTRSDLLKQLGLVLPVQTRNMCPDAAVALLHELADVALSGEVEQVVCLEAPEWPPVPEYLLRDLDGRSVYTRPGTARYATRVQLSMEEKLLADAQRQGAPSLARDQAAQLLGADAQTLDAQLRERAQEARAQLTQAGLRLDQAASLYYALTSPRAVEVIVGPAGSGKTRALAEAARAWIDAGMGQVIGIATSQAARNVLAAAGVHASENSAVFLGHLPGQRSARHQGHRSGHPAGDRRGVDDVDARPGRDNQPRRHRRREGHHRGGPGAARCGR
jgi:TrwC relaxase/AAA domain